MDSVTTLVMLTFDFCLVDIEPHSGADTKGGDYTEVYCGRHEWSCGHRHRKWGAWVRCATRHQEAT